MRAQGGSYVDNRPIGVFDSGLGGLTVVRELKHLLPRERIIYLGDTGRVPYGVRSRETILKYARQDINFLTTFDLKAVMIACGTVSTTSLDTVRTEYPLPIVGVTESAAREAARITKNNKIGLIGTTASVHSGAYERFIHQYNPKAEVFGAACPLFVPLVENGRFRRGDPVIEMVTAEYLAPLKDLGIDTLVLGCTHYPLLDGVISAFMGEGVRLVSTGTQGARHLADLLTGQDALASAEAEGGCHYYVTDSTEDFARLASIFLGSPVSGLVEQISIEKYDRPFTKEPI